MTGSDALRVVVADDSSLFRGLLVDALAQAGIDVVGQASDLDGTLATVERERPDVAILDIRMPPTGTIEGIQAAAAIHLSDAPTGVLLLSQYVETATAADLIESCDGGIGYLLKDRVADVAELVDAVGRVRDGEIVLDPSMIKRLLAKKRTNDPVDRLTPTQRDVLALVSEGRSNKGIAERMYISERTVESHVSVIFDTLGLARTNTDHRRVLAAIAFLRRTD